VGHSDNRAFGEHLSDDMRIGAEPHPARPGHHGDLRIVLIGIREEAPEKGMDSEHGEVIAGDGPESRLTNLPPVEIEIAQGANRMRGSGDVREHVFWRKYS
jgi:hypothetical protein